jgi:hypothetical protein
MKILFTGFNGFNNTSKVIIDKINNDKLLFNNSYKEIDNQLVDINVEDYELIIMLGLRCNLKRSIRLEVNSLLNDELVTTNISYCNVKKYFIDNDISCIVNDKPTNYLCNYAYHKVLKRNKNTIFIHVSELKNIKDLDKLINLISNINITACI